MNNKVIQSKLKQEHNKLFPLEDCPRCGAMAYTCIYDHHNEHSEVRGMVCEECGFEDMG